MRPGMRGSIRVWQIAQFVVVIVVAILTLSGFVSAGLKATLAHMAETSELRNASALAQRLEPEFPIAMSDTLEVRDVITEYRRIYGGGIWVYNADGDLIETASDGSPIDAILEAARLEALDGNASYAVSDLRTGGWVVAAKPLLDAEGELQGAVVTASSTSQSAEIMQAVRGRIWVAFWVSLAIAGLLGGVFSEIISRRMRVMSDAAAAIAAGDFKQQLTTGFVPSELQDLAESYNSMAAKLGETFEAQRRFVADASHEMRTPIAALTGMLELLDDGAKNVPEVRDDFIRTMQTEVERLGRLVRDLLTLAQLEGGNLQLRLAPGYVVDLLGDVGRVMQGLAEQVGVRLAIEVPDEDLRVVADHDRIVQVLLSFTDNALKHSTAGSTVRLRALPLGNTVRLEVIDEGPGIDPEELPRLFERFYRVDTARAGGGTGLGLAIAKEIVEVHGATITVESAPGTGTTFGFNLPRAR